MTNGHGPARAGDGRTDHDAWHGSVDTVLTDCSGSLRRCCAPMRGVRPVRGAAGHRRSDLPRYDKMTGDVISEVELPANQSGLPMIDRLDGKQDIVVAVGARDQPGELVALALP